MTIKTQQLKETLAEVLGENPGAITAINPRWTNLMKEGVVVSLHIKRWRATTSLKEIDLGLGSEDDEIQDIMKLGDKFLLPIELIKKLNSIDAGARTFLAKQGYKTYWGTLIPVTNYHTWKDGNQEFIDRYYQLRDEIYENWDAITDELVGEYQKAARKAYRRHKALDPEYMTSSDWLSEDEYIDKFTSRVLAMRHSARMVYNSFEFEVEMNYIPLPSILESDLQAARAEATRGQLERDNLIESQKLARDKERAEWDLEIEQIRAAEQKAYLEKVEAKTKADERIEMLRQMNEDIVREARKQKEELVDQFLKDVVTQLRGSVYEIVEDVAAAIESAGSLHPRKVVQLQGLIEQVGNLNFYGDTEIDQMIQPVKDQLALSPSDRNPVELSKSLKAIGTLTRATLIGLGERPRKARVEGIPVNPTADQKRKARIDLGLEVEVKAPKKRQSRLTADEMAKKVAIDIVDQVYG